MNPIVEFLVSLLFSFVCAGTVFLITPWAVRRIRNRLALHPDSRLGAFLSQPSDPLVDALFLMIALAALIGLPAESIHSYNSFGSFPDFQVYDGTLWAFLHGTPIDVSYRFNPVLYALVPFYALWSDPRILLTMQSAGFAFVVFPLYWFARKAIGRLPGLVVILAYLANPTLHSINSAVFYEIKLAVPLLALALFFLLRRHYGPFLICVGVALLVKQEVALIAVGFAAFLFFVHRRRRLGFSLAALGMALALFIVQILYPAMHHGQVYPIFGDRFAYLGQTTGEVIQALVLRPDLVIQHISTPERVIFVLSLFVPLALLPLMGLEVTAISLPTFAYTLLSETTQQFDRAQYYQSPLLPFLFFGAVVGLQRLLRWRAEAPRANLKPALLGLLVVSSQLYSPNTWALILNPASFTPDSHSTVGHALLQQIMDNTTIVAQTEFFMPLYVSHRDSVVRELAPHQDYRQTEYLVGDSRGTWYEVHRDIWEHWRASGYFDTIAEQDGYFILLNKGHLPANTPQANGSVKYASAYDPYTYQIDTGWALLGYTASPNSFHQPVQVRFGGAMTLLGYSPLPSGSIQGGDTLNVIAEWQAVQNLAVRYVILVHLVDSQGHVWAQDDREPIVPANIWRTGEIIRDQYVLHLPSTMPPGNYQIRFSVWDPSHETSLSATSAQGNQLGLEITTGTIHVNKDTTNILASHLEIAQPLRVDMNEIRLIGTTTLPQDSGAGDELPVGLYWRAREKPKNDYVVSVQLRDAKGHVVLEEKDRPAAGAYPTPEWQMGEVLLDWHDLTIPPNLGPGQYNLVVSLRDAADQTSFGETGIGQISIR